jgi:tetratricopeptide (TPR) repeat protein
VVLRFSRSGLSFRTDFHSESQNHFFNFRQIITLRNRPNTEVLLSGSRKQIATKLSSSRKGLFIFVLTVVLPFTLLLLFEAVLRIIDYGYPPGFFVQRDVAGQKVFADNPKFSLRFFSPELARPSCHLVIPAEKPPDNFRIFVLGGSAAMGDPDFSFGFSRILETMLQHQYPRVKFEVINTAITAINSNVVLPIARECADLEPDLFIIYLGNNEVIGPYGPGTVFVPFLSHRSFIRASVFLNATKTGQLLNGFVRQLNADEGKTRTWGGVDMFTENRLRFNDTRMSAVYDHFRDNLFEICRIGHRAGAKVIVSTVATNLKNCAPFGSLHRQDLTDSALKEWEVNYNAGIDLESAGKFEEAIVLYQKASAIDAEFADLSYRLARCFWALDQYEEARKHYVNARNLDALRFRADSRINDIIREIPAIRSDVDATVVDAESALQAASPQGIAGDRLFYDHVHLNFTGNYLLARSVKEHIEGILGMESPDNPLSEIECAERLALTPWDRYRMETEILGRMRSPAFAGQLDNKEAIRRREVKKDSLQALLQPNVLSEVLETYLRAIAAREEDWVLRNNFGLLLLEAADHPAGAIEQFRSVQKIFPFDHLTQNNLGLAFARQGKLNQAIGCYKEALQIKPHFPKANFNLGEVLERQGKYDEALTYYYQAHLPEEGLASIHNRYGLRYAGEDRFDEAVRHFEEALRLSPDNAEIHRNLGNTLSQKGETAQAARHLSEAVRLEPDQADAHIDLASLLFVQKDYTGATAHYEKALQAKPDLPEVLNNLGLALCNQGLFEEAVPHFQKALSSKQDFVAARNNLAGALSQLGRSEEAIAHLEASLRTNPDNPSFHNNLGTELMKVGRIEQAVAHFRKALQLNPDYSSAQNNLRYALSRLQNE